ncbi:putative RNA methyltransferase [Jatrophihabitans sp. YIM 134969]
MTAALDRALPLLRCPVGAEPLARVDRSLRCSAGHSFDIARQGYVSLFAGARPHAGDTAAMIAARDRFLASGHYATIAAAVARAVAETAPAGPVLDLAAGTGWYAAQVLDAEPERLGVAVDVSVPGLRRAARAHDRLAVVGADAWATLPVADGAFAAALSVFGPRDPAELARVLTASGVVVTVTPTPGHLAEIIGPLGMLEVGSDKSTRLHAAFGGFDRLATERVERVATLDNATLADLVDMGPTGHHQDPAATARRVATLPDAVPVTVSVEVTTFRRR